MDNNIWGQVAGRYDTEERIYIASIIANTIRKALSGKQTADKSAMEYGCGTGLVGLGLCDLFDQMIMVDASEEMIARSQAKVQTEHVRSVDFVCADFMKQKPSGIAVDYVIVSQVLLHIPDTRRILEILYDTLMPGGVLLAVDFDKNDLIESDRVHNGFDQVELAAHVKESGFSSIYSYTFYHGKRLFMGQDASLFLLKAKKG